MKIVYDGYMQETSYAVGLQDFRDNEIRFYDSSYTDCVAVRFSENFEDVKAVLKYYSNEYDEALITGEYFENFCRSERRRLASKGTIEQTDRLFFVDYKLNRFVLNMEKGVELAWFSIFPPKDKSGIFGHVIGTPNLLRFSENSRWLGLAVAMNYSRRLISDKTNITPDGLDLFYHMLEDKISIPVENLFIPDPESFFKSRKTTSIYDAENTADLISLLFDATGEGVLI